MTTDDSPDRPALVSQESRIERLSRATGFDSLPRAALVDIAELLTERAFGVGETVVREGDDAAELFLIVEGRVEVSVAAGGGSVPLSDHGPGELFGEIALLDPGSKRQATVTAITPLTLLSLAAEEFRRVLSDHPAAREQFAAAARDMLVAKFLKQATPFTAVDGPRLRTLAAKLQVAHVAAHAEILRQGESGRGAYLLRSGRVEVLVRDEGSPERRICTLGPGALFGEGALLTDAPRSATVRAMEPCELLFIERCDLLDLMGSDRKSAGGVLQLLELRHRPRRRTGVSLHARVNHEGETMTVLKDASRGAYFRLSPEGAFLWERLDGRHTLRDLTMDYLTTFKAFAPQAIAEIVAGLADAGFLEGFRLRSDVAAKALAPTAGERALLLASRVLDWKIYFTRVDGVLARCHRRVRWIFTPVAQGALGVIAVGGIVAFAFLTTRLRAEPHAGMGTSSLLAILLPALLFSIVVHEFGHALTAKAFGREVPRVGVGWYWFGPIAFVDTSDMWLAGRWARIAVTVAGPYSNVLLAAVASAVGCFSHNALVHSAAWYFAAVSYALVLFNLNPLLEYDGYYVLIDWLEKPNLRRNAIAWIGQLPTLIKERRGLRGHILHLVYGLAAVVYVLLMAVLFVTSYRSLAQHWVERWLPPAWAAAAVWLPVTFIAVGSLARVVGDLRATRRG